MHHSPKRDAPTALIRLVIPARALFLGSAFASLCAFALFNLAPADRSVDLAGVFPALLGPVLLLGGLGVLTTRSQQRTSEDGGRAVLDAVSLLAAVVSLTTMYGSALMGLFR